MDVSTLQPLIDQGVWFHDYIINFSWFLVGVILGMGFIYGFFR